MKAININGFFIVFENTDQENKFVHAHNLYDGTKAVTLNDLTDAKGYGFIDLSYASPYTIDKDKLFTYLDMPIDKSEHGMQVSIGVGGDTENIQDADAYCRSEYGVGYRIMKIITSE